jgi:hypothetical protein
MVEDRMQNKNCRTFSKTCGIVYNVETNGRKLSWIEKKYRVWWGKPAIYWGKGRHLESY